MTARHSIRLPPKLYSLPFVARTFGYVCSTIYSAVTGKYGSRDEGVRLRHWGRICYRGRSAYVLESAALSLYLGCPPKVIDRIFQVRIKWDVQQNIFPPFQKYLVETPYENLEWLSDFVHHDGKGIHNGIPTTLDE